jgi:hypothetical protein
MNEPVGTPLPEPMPEAPRKSNQGLIIGIVVAVVLCCCCLVLVGGWFFGDQILQSLNMQF